MFHLVRHITCAITGASAALFLLAATATDAHAIEGMSVSPPVISCNISSIPTMGTFRFTPQLADFDSDPDTGLYSLASPTGRNGIWGGTTDILLQELEFDPDPTVFNNILVTNVSAVTQTYVVTISLPTIFPGPNLMYGSITTQVIDHQSNGATIAALTGKSIYSALVDAAVVRTMQDDVFSVVAPPASVNNALDNFGPEVNPLAVASSIGIRLEFSLSPGDSAAILSRFDVLAIPEPASLSLLALLTLTLRRTRP